jgi:hypothetical protein
MKLTTILYFVVVAVSDLEKSPQKKLYDHLLKDYGTTRKSDPATSTPLGKSNSAWLPGISRWTSKGN